MMTPYQRTRTECHCTRPHTGPCYECECDREGAGEERKPYRVRDHEGTVSICMYCDDCAALARVDWNGTTAVVAGPLDAIPRTPVLGPLAR